MAVNPMEALESLQRALDRGVVELTPCLLASDLSVIMDQPTENTRFTYVKREGERVVAIALLAFTQPVKGVPCFQLGYAVVEAMRRKGLGVDIVKRGIAELKAGLGQYGPARFYVEAIVPVSNEASKRVAERALSAEPIPCDDAFTGEPSFQYLRLVE